MCRASSTKKAFSLAEMMTVMLILSIVLAASMPIITKRTKKTPIENVWQYAIGSPNSIYNTNSGNVGIGTGLPEYRLDIAYKNDNYSLAYGENKSRTENLDDAGNSTQSGFYQTDNPSNYPGSGSWHLLNVKRGEGNYAMQIAGKADDQNLYFRNTNNNPSQVWTMLNVPPGTIVAYAGAAIPDGWLLCNGQSISGNPKYAALATLIGNNVPDLRGEFIRGLDNGRGVDTGRTLRSSQAGMFEQHTHTVRTYWDGHYGYAKTYQAGNGGSTDGVAASTMNTSQVGGTETRPRNIALNYIIKY